MFLRRKFLGVRRYTELEDIQKNLESVLSSKRGSSSFLDTFGVTETGYRTPEGTFRIFRRVVDILIIILAAATALMTFDQVRQYGVSLLASAGAAGIVVGLALQPLLKNLLAGVQLAVTQPIWYALAGIL